MNGENKRQWIHLLVGGFALLIRWLTWWQAVLLACLAIFNNFVVMPLFKIDKSFLRKDEPFLSGVKLYPLVVLALILVFCNHLPVAAGCWAILAVGDSVSNLIGRRYGTRKLPWNAQKSWAGTVAFVAASIPAAFLTIWWTQLGHGPVNLCTALSMAAAGSIAAALAESLPLRLDDNVSIGISSGLAMVLVGIL